MQVLPLKKAHPAVVSCRLFLVQWAFSGHQSWVLEEAITDWRLVDAYLKSLPPKLRFKGCRFYYFY